MALRKTVRLVATAVFALMLAPVVGDFFVEAARENGLYTHPTARIQAVVDWMQSIFGEQGFFWMLFAIGGLTAGLWIESFLKRAETPPDPVQALRGHLDGLIAMAPDPLVADWGPLSKRGTEWLSEIKALHLLMLKAGFEAPPLTLHQDKWHNLDLHQRHWGHIAPLLASGQIGEARAANATYCARLRGEFAEQEAIPVYHMPSKLMKLLGVRPARLVPPDTGEEKQQ